MGCVPEFGGHFSPMSESKKPINLALSGAESAGIGILSAETDDFRTPTTAFQSASEPSAVAHLALPIPVDEWQATHLVLASSNVKATCAVMGWAGVQLPGTAASAPESWLGLELFELEFAF
jgi:hypothetical protein